MSTCLSFVNIQGLSFLVLVALPNNLLPASTALILHASREGPASSIRNQLFGSARLDCKLVPSREQTEFRRSSTLTAQPKFLDTQQSPWKPFVASSKAWRRRVRPLQSARKIQHALHFEANGNSFWGHTIFTENLPFIDGSLGGRKASAT